MSPKAKRSEAAPPSPGDGLAEQLAKEEAAHAASEEKRAAAPKAKAAKAPPAPTDPRVIEAIKATMAVISAPKVTPELEARMMGALDACLGYELEKRAPMLAGDFDSEAALGCAVVGAIALKYKTARQLAVEAAKAAQAQQQEGAAPPA